MLINKEENRMVRLRVRRPSAALIVSTIALIVALGGTSYAAFALPRNSVGTKQLKNNAVTTSKIKNGAVTGPKVNLGSLGVVPNASHANNATIAGHATTADSATNAGHATTADSATNAGHASTADSAANATSINGFQVKKFSTSLPLNTATTTLIDLGGVSITGACNGLGTATISANKDAGQPTMAFNFTSASTGNGLPNTSDGTSDFSSFDLTSSPPNTTGEFIATSSAATTTANYIARGGSSECLFAGTVISG